MTRAANLTATRTDDLFASGAGSWEVRLARIVDLVREMSLHTDPQEMVRAYGGHMRRILPVDRSISLSRRGLEAPAVKITRSSLWEEAINPWTEPNRLPVIRGGILAELIYGDEPRIIDNFELDPDDPGAEHLAGQRSLMALPLYDQGKALNMVLLGRSTPNAFSRDQFPELVWMGNLFGRATHSLVMAQQLRRAYEMVEFEMKTVADIQRSLLPSVLPRIPTMDLAAYYRTSSQAGGDYYDFFELSGGRWGILLADVSGHGTPAAVVMAITHSIAHMFPGEPSQPSKLLQHINGHLCKHYTARNGTFVTAFYGVYDPATRELTYSCAGHEPPRIKHCGDGTMSALQGGLGLPLGIDPGEAYPHRSTVFKPLDQIIFYTDGITEAQNGHGEMFGIARLDRVLSGCRHNAEDLIEDVTSAVEKFTGGEAPTDDRTILVAKIS